MRARMIFLIGENREADIPMQKETELKKYISCNSFLNRLIIMSPDPDKPKKNPKTVNIVSRTGETPVLHHSFLYSIKVWKILLLVIVFRF